ncbi:MAG: DinB family protein [Bacteroidota bacterium]
MNIERTQLIADLKKQVQSATDNVLGFRELDHSQLNFKKSADSWSILECLEHLNRYGDFYLPEIEKQLINAPKSPEATVFSSGVLGNYFANMMLPKDGKISKMKTFKKMDPANSNLSVTVLEKFVKQQERLQALLNLAADADLTRIKTGITLTSLLRFRLGDTFRFFVNHIERHVRQATLVNN